VTAELAPPADRTATMPAVGVTELVKRYPKATVNAVDGVSFSVMPGEIFGLLGPNGAGKTTTVGVLTTRVHATSGTAQVSGVDVGRDPVGARRRLAVVPQRNNLDRSVSIRQNLLFHAAYHGTPARDRGPRADELLEEFGLSERANDKPARFSGGQEQRVMIARALMHAPDVLFLDEPSTGLDPAARLFVWDRIRDLKARGVTIVLTTHDMDEADALADRVGIMDHGTLLALDTPAALTRSLPGSTTLDVTLRPPDGVPPDELISALAGLSNVERVEPVQDATGAPGGGELRLRLYVSGEAPPLVAPVATLLREHDATLSDVTIGTPSLEDVFIHFTGRMLR
jgi:ABC-2 type transport system ATP-binding protein